MKNVKILLWALTGAALLFSACGGIFDNPESQQGLDENGYGKLRINLVGEEVPSELKRITRTTLPDFEAAGIGAYEYWFAKDGGDAAAKEPDANGYFSLLPGSYTVTVKGFLNAGNPNTDQVVEGTSGTFTVPGTSQVTVKLDMYGDSVNTGTLECTIQTPSDAEIDSASLTQWGDSPTAVGGFSKASFALKQDALSNDIPGVYTVTQSSLASGYYLLSYVVKGKDASGYDVYAGTIEAIHIYPGMTTTYTKAFERSDMSGATPIKNIAVTVPKPLAGVTPVNTTAGATISAAAPFTLNSVQWKSSGSNYSSPFAGGNSYTVEIVLAPKSGFMFNEDDFDGANAANATINTETATLSVAGSGNATLSYEFTTKAVDSISVTPTTLTYTYPATLDLSSVVVTITYDVDDEDTVTYSAANFAEYGITTSAKEHGDALAVSDVSLTISCAGETATITLDVAARDLDDAEITVVLTQDSYSYTGNAVTFASSNMTITDAGNNDADLVEGTDYVTIVAGTDFANNTNVGTATLTITGTGNYTGTKTIPFTITPLDLETLSLAVVFDGTYDLEYDGSPKVPPITKIWDTASLTLTENDDYDSTTVEYSANVNASDTPVVTIHGLGPYLGSTLNATFTITKATPTLDNFAASNLVKTYTGAAQEPTVSWVGSTTGYGAITLTYTNEDNSAVSGGSPKNVGNYKIKVATAGGDNYNAFTATVLVDDNSDPILFKIDKATIQPSDFAPITAKTYTGDGVSLNPTTEISLASKTGAGTFSNVKYNGTSVLPVKAGDYAITVDVGYDGSNFNGRSGVSVGTLTINKKTPVVGDFVITGPGSSGDGMTVTADGIAKAVGVQYAGKHLNSDLGARGDITVYYNDGSGKTTQAPLLVGSYVVTFDVAAGDNFNSVTGLSAGTLVIQ